MHARSIAAAFIVVAALGVAAWSQPIPTKGVTPVYADEPWTIQSFDARYAVQPDGSVAVIEDLDVDFGSLRRHGIFRDIRVEYPYDGRTHRLLAITGVRVDDGTSAVPFSTSRDGPSLRIQIGDADKLVTGRQRYRISYVVRGAIEGFSDHDELFWNVTGNEWPVPINAATARLGLPKPGLQRVACYEGPSGSTTPCRSSNDESNASFEASQMLAAGSGLTIVAGWQKGMVEVPPPILIQEKNPLEEAADFLGLRPALIALSAAMGIAVLAMIARLWWIAGRDRWYGKNYYIRRRTG